jgi:hypothetical protein
MLAGSVQFTTEPVAHSCGRSNLTSCFIKFTEFNYANSYRLIKKDSAAQSSLFSYVVSWLVLYYTVTTGSPSNLGFNHTKLNSGSANLPSEVLYLLLKDAAPIPGILEGHDSTYIPESD